MKGVFLFLCIGLLLTLNACSVTEQSASDVGNRFQDGLQGRGQIVPNDPTSDSFGADYR
ncbi:MAG: hypothetical protein IAE94_09260 [Chthoniobacterales bacterium]|jgi:hypothetical protein|nr:hypothetical protein [Chthoniobacterales bacterium]